MITLSGSEQIVAGLAPWPADEVCVLSLAPGELPGPDTTLWVPPYPPGDLDFVRRALAATPQLSVIQLMTAGVEPWPSLVGPDVSLCSGRGLHGASTAELALTLLLALIRELPALALAQAQQQWSHRQTGELAGQRVLVVGAGDIGQRVATLVSAFGAVASVVGRSARAGVHAVSELPALLPDHDAVVIAAPASAETVGLVNADFLAAMPDNAILVNIARGSIVVTADLLGELRAGRLRAGIDVAEVEPLPPSHPLWTAPGLIITPHIGGGTAGWVSRARELVRSQVECLRAGRPLANVVRRS